MTDKQILLMRQQATLILAQHKAGQKLAPQALTWAKGIAFGEVKDEQLPAALRGKALEVF